MGLEWIKQVLFSSGWTQWTDYPTLGFGLPWGAWVR